MQEAIDNNQYCSGSDGKESTCQCRRPEFDPWVGKIPWKKARQPTLQYSCLENPHRQRSLAGYSPWVLTKSDITEQLSTAQHCGPLINSFQEMELIPGIWYEYQNARWGQAWESAKSALLEKVLLSFLQYRILFPYSNFKLNSTHPANDLEVWATTLASYFLSPSWSNYSSSWPLPYLRPSSNSLSFAVMKEYSLHSFFHHPQGNPSEIPSAYESLLLNTCPCLPMW